MGSSSARIGLIALVGVMFGFAASAAPCDVASVDLRSGDAVARFSVEVADTDEERALGLMNRDKLAGSSGMLFVYETPRRASFWMKNTLIPLDMIFADTSGRVTRVQPMAKPLDLTPIDGGDDVRFVLEINGGLAKRRSFGTLLLNKQMQFGPVTAIRCFSMLTFLATRHSSGRSAAW
jgi:uncharacterized protein